MIKLDSNTIKKTKSGKITGIIYLQLSEKYFPEVGWNDFPVTILNWWCENFLKGKEGNYYFMDGPFYFKILKKNDTYYLETFSDGKPLFFTILDITIFEYSLINVIDTLLKTINTKEWNSEVETLNENLYKLKKSNS